MMVIIRTLVLYGTKKRDIFFSNPHLKKKKKKHARLGKHLGLQLMISHVFGLLSYLQSGVMALPL